MSNLQDRVRDYLDSRKPKYKVAESVTIEPVDELEKSIEDMKQAWADVFYPFRTLIRLAKIIFYLIVVLVVMSAFVIVGMQTRCYLDSKCSEEMERVNR
jgi:hypothetical protein